jgi:hypothetical protein
VGPQRKINCAPQGNLLKSKPTMNTSFRTSFQVNANGTSINLQGGWNGHQYSGRGYGNGQMFTGHGMKIGNMISGTLRCMALFAFSPAVLIHFICSCFCILGQLVCLRKLSHIFRQSVPSRHQSVRLLQQLHLASKYVRGHLFSLSQTSILACFKTNYADSKRCVA